MENFFRAVTIFYYIDWLFFKRLLDNHVGVLLPKVLNLGTALLGMTANENILPNVEGLLKHLARSQRFSGGDGFVFCIATPRAVRRFDWCCLTYELTSLFLE